MSSHVGDHQSGRANRQACQTLPYATEDGHSMQQRWPSRLWVVRHGESAGNVAADAAHGAGLARIDIADRDVDVPLSARGEQQADAVGRWFAAIPVGERPETVLTSPYLRARQ